MSSSSEHALHFVAGALGGTLGAVITCPLEVAKTRLQGINASYGNTALLSHNVGQMKGNAMVASMPKRIWSVLALL